MRISRAVITLSLLSSTLPVAVRQHFLVPHESRVGDQRLRLMWCDTPKLLQVIGMAVRANMAGAKRGSSEAGRCAIDRVGVHDACARRWGIGRSQPTTPCLRRPSSRSTRTVPSAVSRSDAGGCPSARLWVLIQWAAFSGVSSASMARKRTNS